jgi:N-acetylglucosamine kinase-like BadF-type ATPase
MTNPGWLLGVDGGGSKTAVHVAQVTDGVMQVVASITGEPSNLRALGTETALANLNHAIDLALVASSAPRIDRAVLALAGSQTAEASARIHEWAETRSLAARVSVVHDIDPVLTLAAVNGQALALIAGTGSAAGAQHASGRRIVVGGWGHWIDDRGSAFAIGRRALAAVANAADGLGPKTALTEILLAHFEVKTARDILTKLGIDDVRRTIANCAVCVTRAADSVDLARQIVEEAARDAAELLIAAADQADIGSKLSLAVAGGVACNSDLFRRSLIERLTAAGREPSHMTIVQHPVDGCLQMALAQDGKSV